jgi:hypothetical protein
MKPETFATFVPGAAESSSFWSPAVQRLPARWRTQLIDLPEPVTLTLVGIGLGAGVMISRFVLASDIDSFTSI